MKQSDIMLATEWYEDYIRFLAALKNRLTVYYEKDKWEPIVPSYILEKLNQLHKIRNKYYKHRNENDRICLRQLTRELKTDICIYRSDRWNDFLSIIQQNP